MFIPPPSCWIPKHIPFITSHFPLKSQISMEQMHLKMPTNFPLMRHWAFSVLCITKSALRWLFSHFPLQPVHFWVHTQNSWIKHKKITKQNEEIRLGTWGGKEISYCQSGSGSAWQPHKNPVRLGHMQLAPLQSGSALPAFFLFVERADFPQLMFSVIVHSIWRKCGWVAGSVPIVVWSVNGDQILCPVNVIS